MKLLCMDTSTRVLSLAVSQDDRILKSRHVSLDGFLSSSIIPSIQKILKDARVKLEDLDGFAVGLGPGSFTSLRVGLATIKGLSFATGKPVVGIPSLDILAMSAPGARDCLICPIMDARRNMVYACLYEKKGKILKRKSPYLLTLVADLSKYLKKDQKIFFVGDAVTFVKEKKGVKNFIFADSKFNSPQAQFLVPLVLERFRKKTYDESEKIVPLYLYSQDCQVQP